MPSAGVVKKKLVVWGASGHALVVADAVRLAGEYEIAGFLDDLHPGRHGEQFCGALVLGGVEMLDSLWALGVEAIFFGFGNCAARLKLADLVAAKGFSLPTIVHPRAVVANDAVLGPGAFVAAGAVVNSQARIGAQVIVNTCASVDHESVVEDGAHICPGVHLAGGVVVGRASWVGIGASVVDKVRIGAGSIIGAGAVVVGDIPDGVMAYGVPARVIREVGDER
jgi:UDP-N-acetylbacillosamine N-acetyltransferase